MKWVALVTVIAVGLVQLPSPVVRIRSGLLRGTLGTNGRFYQFLGVPYGTVDDRNRFQAPLPPPTWDGVYDAINENTWCPQRFQGSIITIGQPDCLKLNIYAPTTAKPDSPIPVMVFIHGGCFFEGVGSRFLYSGEYFTDHGVIFVGINYRLNIEGFLCLGIQQAPGNAGLKDQIAALKWIKENIKSFGGDPDNVTLFGESAGAVSTSLLLLSPLAKGLFHKAILQSGSSVVPWGIQHDPIRTASSLVKEFGYNTKDPYELYDIISKKSHDELIRAIKYVKSKTWITADNLFVPCIEKELDGIEPIISRFPLDVIESSNYTKVPLIVGYNDMEGLFFVSKDFGTSLKEADARELIKRDLLFPNKLERDVVAEQIQRHYFSVSKKDLVFDMVNLYSDLHFKFPSVIESELYAKNAEHPIYYYLFKYGGAMNIPKFISLFFGAGGAAHADELFYMMRPFILPTPQRATEHVMMERMLTFDPTPKTSEILPLKWEPSREWNPRALVIDEHLTTAPLWHMPSIRLWNETYSKYRRKDYGFKVKNGGDCLTETCVGRRTNSSTSFKLSNP
ncbi:hypothetical protein ACJJTC_012975 [Scirpophaga incertulas]